MGIFDWFKKIVKDFNDEQNAVYELNKKKQELQSQQLKDFQDKIFEIFSNLKGIDLFKVLPVPNDFNKTFSYEQGVLSFLFGLSESEFTIDNYWYFCDDINHYLIKKSSKGLRNFFRICQANAEDFFSVQWEEDRYDYVKINKLKPPPDAQNAIMEEIIFDGQSKVVNMRLESDLNLKKWNSNARFIGRGYILDYFQSAIIITKEITNPSPTVH